VSVGDGIGEGVTVGDCSIIVGVTVDVAAGVTVGDGVSVGGIGVRVWVGANVAVGGGVSVGERKTWLTASGFPE